MKVMHKLLAMVLSLTLVLAMATTAFAEDEVGGTLKVEGTSNVVYTIYKVCDVEIIQINDTTAEGGTVKKDAYKYKLATGWEGFVNFKGVSDYFTINGDYLNWLGDSASAVDGAAIAQLAHNYLEAHNKTAAEDNKIKPVAPETVTVGQSVDLGSNGYYLLVPNDGTTCGVVVVAGKNKTIQEKSTAEGHPTVTKTVLEDSLNRHGEHNDVDIGQVITFQTTITAGGHDSNYILHDKMGTHLEWLGGGNITRDGNLLNPGTDKDHPGDYYVVENPQDCEGCTFHVVFPESITSSLHKGATLVVNYFAVLKDGSPSDHNHTNETWLTYTKENVPSNKASTVTNTYDIQIKKVDQDGNALEDAGFVLIDVTGKFYKKGNPKISWGTTDKMNSTNVVGIEWVDKETDATTIYSDKDGIAIFEGVDAENFTIKEVVIPKGYTGAGVVQVTTKEGVQNGVKEVTITNVLGNALPETGGMGTTMFYVVGSLLAAAAVVLMLTKKRVSAK